jgi:hypothetical protein
MTNVLQDLINMTIELDRKLADVKGNISNFQTNKAIQTAHEEATKQVKPTRESVNRFVGVVNSNSE